ncbi:MAG: ATP-binding protein [Chloroflexota bacterium]|nr:ATP-binding protein [Chloroflexota bacterium]
MNRLWVRLSLAFMFFVIIGPVLVLSIGLLVTRTDTLFFFVRSELTTHGSLTTQLAEHYQTWGSWDGVETLIESYDAALPRRPEGQIFSLAFFDEGNRLLYPQSPPQSGDTANITNRETRLPIVVQGRTRGYLSIQQWTTITDFPPAETAQAFLLQQISTALIVLGIASAALGLFGGVMISRWLAAPLARLESTVRQFGKRNFKVRASVTGSTEMRSVAQAFNEMAADLEQAEALRRNLLADVAHELRTPLSVLQGNLQALTDGVFPLEKDEIARLMQQTDMLTRLVNDLRELAQAEAHQLALMKTEIDLKVLVQSTVESFKAAAVQRDVQLVVDLPQTPVKMQAEAGQVRQVLNNLLQNALTHTPDGGTIHVHLDTESSYVIIEVADTGSGIASEHLPHIFDRFYRTDRSRSRDTGGSGLGLAIAKAFVELHGGTIAAASLGEVGKGSTFTIKFPH